MLRIAIFVCFAAAQLFAGEAKRADRPTAPRTQLSQQQLDRIRQSLMAQIAVWDSAENAMRAPTLPEAAAIAAPATAAPATPTKLQNGGLAVRRDGSNLSFAIATTGEDGRIRITHGSAATARKEGSDAR